MSKVEDNIIKNLRSMTLAMLKKEEDEKLFKSVNVFYTLFMNYLNFDVSNPDWVNRDRIVLSNEFLPTYYSTLSMFGYDISVDNLSDYNTFESSTPAVPLNKTPGIEIGSFYDGDLVGYAAGIALGERYFENLSLYEKKSSLIDFHTFCVVSSKDFNSGISLEALSLVAKEELNKLVYIVILDKDEEIYLSKSSDFNIIEAKNKISSIEGAIEEAIESKKPTIIYLEYFEAKGEKVEPSYEVAKEVKEEIRKNISKRLDKELSKWNNAKSGSNNSKVLSTIKFMKSKEMNIDFDVDNLKLNDNYDEELNKGNDKIFNIFTSKSPYILSVSNKSLINKEDVMSTLTPLGRNIVINNIISMGTISLGLSSLGFKIFLTTPLTNSNLLRPFIKFSAMNNLDVTYIFTDDSFTNMYESKSLVDEINSLRIIPNILNFRPCDINEIIGSYGVFSVRRGTNTLIIGSEKEVKLRGTNPKYVLAGLYRVKREKGEANGVIVASGTEVHTALKLADELIPYNIDLRVVTAPCVELFESQEKRYKDMLLPKDLKIFVLDHSNTNYWNKYASDSNSVFGVDKYVSNGTKAEMLKYYELDMDSLKRRIVEKYKS